MLIAVVDTHAILWHLYRDARLSSAARRTIESAAPGRDTIGLSTISLAEVLYLTEKRRIDDNAFHRLLTTLDQPNSILEELPVDRAVVVKLPSISRALVPDLPDGLIAATARAYRVPLVTVDR